jgi:hypothetical protein
MSNDATDPPVADDEDLYAQDAAEELTMNGLKKLVVVCLLSVLRILPCLLHMLRHKNQAGN